MVFFAHALAVVLSAAEPSSLELVGVLLADEPGDRAAVLRDLQTGRSMTVRPEDRVAGGQVLHVARGRVLIRWPGGVEEIASSQAWTEELRCDSRAFDAFVGSRELTGAQVRIVPSFVNGAPVGFKLFSIRPGSALERAGLKNGDVITRLNGFDLTSPEKALQLYSTLRCARRYEAELLRAGEKVLLIVLLL